MAALAQAVGTWLGLRWADGVWRRPHGWGLERSRQLLQPPSQLHKAKGIQDTVWPRPSAEGGQHHHSCPTLPSYVSVCDTIFFFLFVHLCGLLSLLFWEMLIIFYSIAEIYLLMTTFVEKFLWQQNCKVQIVEGPPLCSFLACLFVCLFGSCNITMCHVPSIMSFMAYCEEKVLQTLLERSSSTNVCPFPNFLGENSDWLCFSSQCMCELFNIFFLGGGGRMPPGCVDDEMPLSTFSNILKSADYYHYR